MRVYAWLAAAAVLIGCDSRSRAINTAYVGESFEVAVPIPKWAQGGVARVEGVVTGADMASTLVVEMEVGTDNIVRGAFDGVKPGIRRRVTLNAYDSAGALLYTGSTETDVVEGQTTAINISLAPVTTEIEDTATGVAGEEIVIDLPGGVPMDFVWIEPGTFLMGSPEDEVGRVGNETPQHEVTISQGFYLGKYEITQGQWEAVMGTKPWLGENGVQDHPDHPAVYMGRCTGLYRAAKRGGWCGDLPAADRSRMGVRLPRRDDDPLVVWRRREPTGRLRVVSRERLGSWTDMAAAGRHEIAESVGSARYARQRVRVGVGSVW